MTVLVRLGAVQGSRRFAFELVKPSSVDITGSGSETATVSALGSIEFSAAATLSLNDVFSSGYDNYMIVMRSSSSAAVMLRARLRSAGSDTAGTGYTIQHVESNDSTVSGARFTSQSVMEFGPTASTQRGGNVIYVYGPYLTQPTAARGVSAIGFSTTFPGNIRDGANTHSGSTSFDGITFLLSSGTISGRVAVYGMRG